MPLSQPSAPDGRMLAADWAEGFMDAFGLIKGREQLERDMATMR